MSQVTATDFCRNFELYQREAKREPIEVTAYGRVTGYFLSPEAFERYRRLSAASRQACYPDELPDHLKHAIRESRMDPKHDHLDTLLDSE
jgi:hypothetical protein